MSTVQIQKPLCQILERTLSADDCRDLQRASNPHKCFGCGSPYRLCRECRERVVTFPEVPFCQECLATKLEEEKLLTPGGSATPCKKCTQRKVAYFEYELCLHCTVEEYEPQDLGELTMPDNPPSDSDVSPAPIKARRKWSRTKNWRQHLDAAINIAESKGIAHQQLLMKELQISQPNARLLLEEMSRLGVISPPKPGPHPRTFLRRPSGSASTSNGHTPNNGTLSEKVRPPLADILPNNRLPATEQDRAMIVLGLQLVIDRAQNLLNRAKENN